MGSAASMISSEVSIPQFKYKGFALVPNLAIPKGNMAYNAVPKSAGRHEYPGQTSKHRRN